MTLGAQTSEMTAALAPGIADVLDAALDAVIAMDADGRVLHWNRSAQRTFGYTVEQAVGREMADLIVPPRHREAHRRGLARLLSGAAPTLLDQRVETQAIGADGSERPVELTVTRLPQAGAPIFVGYVRDISDRLAAERELRASRHRLLEAAYATRRRFERDLHDGAQQRLIGTGIALQLLRARVNDGDELAALIDEARDELTAATAELRELARGLHPAVLTQGGLRPALRALTGRAPIPVAVEGVPAGRLPTAVETTAYFTLAEGLTNVARHSGAGSATIAIEHDAALLRVTLTDDGRGGASVGGGSGLAGLRDRAAALDGRLWVEEAAGGGTRLVLEVPCASD
ncbi:MAG TPA: PAS domain S-box protein [Conexibacter sp.]|nr:PAS domain S-box protein [Conexibacter sp.]